jgi:hypothetical protein
LDPPIATKETKKVAARTWRSTHKVCTLLFSLTHCCGR